MDCFAALAMTWRALAMTWRRLAMTWRSAAPSMRSEPHRSEMSRGAVSERAADAAFGGDGAALVRHHGAFDRAEQCDVPAGLVVEAGAGHRAGGVALARRREGEVLPDQDRVDGAVADPLQRDHAAMQVGLQGVIGAEEGRHPGYVEFAALLEVLQRAAADPQALRRTGLAEAVEYASDIAQPRRRGQHIAVADILAEAVGDLRADEPAVIIGP